MINWLTYSKVKYYWMSFTTVISTLNHLEQKTKKNTLPSSPFAAPLPNTRLGWNVDIPGWHLITVHPRHHATDMSMTNLYFSHTLLAPPADMEQGAGKHNKQAPCAGKPVCVIRRFWGIKSSAQNCLCLSSSSRYHYACCGSLYMTFTLILTFPTVLTAPAILKFYCQSQGSNRASKLWST